ncbi:MAG TPA: M18 family aminopeptidase, partial [Thiotrichales bacterium]|nr:M18 family aminopeptidase [Thiotrichales bacterium]
MLDTEFVNGLLSFLQASPTQFHAVGEMAQQLDAAGFQRLREADAWSLQSKGKYYVTRNDASIVAFVLNRPLPDNGFRMVGAHTDSPCLKVKPNPEIINNSYLQLGVEIYGGALLNPWFDRDLSLAGKVSFLDDKGAIQQALIDFEKAVAVIPSLAIHLDREANKKRCINAQKHMPPVLMKLPAGKDDKADFRKILLSLVQAQHPSMAAASVLDYELSFYDAQAPAVIGLHDDFIASARLDNLLSCYTGL